GASITRVTTTDNTVYTVAVNTDTGNGTIQLNYHDDADVTVDGNNIPLNGSAAVTPLTIPGPTYTVSKSVATSLALAAPSPASVPFGSTGLVTFSATVTVTFTAADKTYDGNNMATGSNCVIATGKVGSDDVTCSVAGGTFASSNANASAQTVSATATLGGSKASNYTVTNPVTTTAKINPAPVTVTFTAADKTYDGTNTAAVSNCNIATGKVGGDDVTCSVAGGTFVSSNEIG